MHPSCPQTPHPVSWRDQVGPRFAQLIDKRATTLAFGNGRSYGDSCLAASDHVIHTLPLNRLIQADWETGLLTAEAGVTLGEILAVAIPKGWFLPVTPGTKFVTLAGAVANDVHGKNHHVRGTFGRHVESLGLVRSDRGDIICAADMEADLFKATIGGLGLTGIITWATVQLMRIATTRLDTVSVRFDSLAEFFDLSRELDRDHEYTVSWVDCLATGSSAGRGIFVAANHAESGALTVATQRKLTVPFTPPFTAVNRLTLKIFNGAYYRRHPQRRLYSPVEYDGFFYPLDSILHWNRIYGRRGFQQFQCVIPQQSAPTAIRALLDAIAASGQGSFLAVLKRCGELGSPGLLSFPLAGTSLALDFSQGEILDSDLLPRLDAIVREAEGRLYPAKDAHMNGEDFRHAYPQWHALERLRDPGLCSRFWQRVTAR